MYNMIKAEFLRGKRSSISKIVIAMPFANCLISFILMGWQNGAFNWWYSMLSPATLALICSAALSRGKNQNYKPTRLSTVPQPRIWVGKIVYAAVLFFISSLFFSLGVHIIGLIGQENVTPKINIYATTVLFLSFLFLLPVALYLCDRFNAAMGVTMTIALSVALGLITWNKPFWRVCPFAVPNRLMCGILGVYPNGLPITGEAELFSSDPVMSTVLINLSYFIVLSVITSVWFSKKRYANERTTKNM